MVLVCDTGVLIAAERGSPELERLARRAAHRKAAVVVPVVCIAQAWRGGARQARLLRFLSGCYEVDLDPVIARRAGELLAATETSDVVDAVVAASARDGDLVLTSDPADLRRLVDASGARARVEAV